MGLREAISDGHNQDQRPLTRAVLEVSPVGIVDDITARGVGGITRETVTTSGEVVGGTLRVPGHVRAKWRVVRRGVVGRLLLRSLGVGLPQGSRALGGLLRLGDLVLDVSLWRYLVGGLAETEALKKLGPSRSVREGADLVRVSSGFGLSDGVLELGRGRGTRNECRADSGGSNEREGDDRATHLAGCSDGRGLKAD